MTNDDIASASLDAIIRAAPAALANARWVLANPSAALRELETKLVADAVLGKTSPCGLDDAAFPWFRLGVESANESTHYWLRGRDRLGRNLGATTREFDRWSRERAAKPLAERGGTCPQGERDELVVEFFISGQFFGEIVLDGRHYLNGDAELRTLVLWAEHLVGLGEEALAGSASGSSAPSGPRFSEPSSGLSAKAHAVREVPLPDPADLDLKRKPAALYRVLRQRFGRRQGVTPSAIHEAAEANGDDFFLNGAEVSRAKAELNEQLQSHGLQVKHLRSRGGYFIERSS